MVTSFFTQAVTWSSEGACNLLCPEHLIFNLSCTQLDQYHIFSAHKCIFRPLFTQLLLSAFLSKHFGLFCGRREFPPSHPQQQRYVEGLQNTPCVHPAHHGQHRAYGHQSFDCSLNTVLTGIRCINGSGYWPLPAIACYMSSWLNDIIKEHILYCRYFKGLMHCLSLGHMAG